MIRRLAVAGLLCLLFSAAAWAQLAQSIVHSSLTLSGSGSTSGSKAFGSNVTAGNTIFVAFTFRDGTGSLFTGYTIAVTDTESNTFTRLQSACSVYDSTAGRTVIAYIYTASVGSSAADTISISISGGTNIRGGGLWAAEVTGNVAASYATVCNAQYNGAAAITTISTAESSYTASAFAFATVQYDGGNTCSLSSLPTGSWSVLQEDTANSEFDLIYPTSGNVSPTNFTNTCSGSGANGALVFGAGKNLLTPSLDGSATGAFAGTSSGTASLTTTLTNDIIITCVFSEKVSGSPANVSSVSGGSLTWAIVPGAKYQPTSNSTYDEECWWAYASGTLSATITVNLDSSVDAASIIAQGVNGAENFTAPFDPNPSLPGFSSQTSGALIGATISTSVGLDVLIGVVGAAGNHTWAAACGVLSTLIAAQRNIAGTNSSNLGTAYGITTGTLSSQAGYIRSLGEPCPDSFTQPGFPMMIFAVAAAAIPGGAGISTLPIMGVGH